MDYNEIKQIIDDNIKPNTSQDITAIVANLVMTAMIDYTRDSIIDIVNQGFGAGAFTWLDVEHGAVIPYPQMSAGRARVVRIFKDNVEYEDGEATIGGVNGITIKRHALVICLEATNEMANDGMQETVGDRFAVIQSDNEIIFSLEVTKTELDNLIANEELIPNVLYKITEVETWMKQGDTTKAIYLHAISTNELEKKGMGEFYVPKYNQGEAGYGIWSGELWQKTGGAMGTEPSYNVDDVVIWGGKHWKNLTGNYGTFIDHYELDSTNWEEIPVNDTDYNVRTNIIEYDYTNDMITYRKDDVGNEVSTSYENWKYLEDNYFDGDPLSSSNYNPIKVFQWGNEFDYDFYLGVGFNVVENGVFECVNQRGIIFNNTLENNGRIYNNTLNNGYISNNTLKNNGYIYNNTLNDGHISNNTLENNGRISNNTLKNNGRILNNTLNNGRILNNTLENNGRIFNNTLKNNGYIRLGLSNPINGKQLRYLTVNTGDIGGNSGIDLSSATLVYHTYERIVFKNSTGVTKIRYFDEKEDLVVADLTD